MRVRVCVCVCVAVCQKFCLRQISYDLSHFRAKLRRKRVVKLYYEVPEEIRMARDQHMNYKLLLIDGLQASNLAPCSELLA